MNLIHNSRITAWRLIHCWWYRGHLAPEVARRALRKIDQSLAFCDAISATGLLPVETIPAICAFIEAQVGPARPAGR